MVQRAFIKKTLCKHLMNNFTVNETSLFIDIPHVSILPLQICHTLPDSDYNFVFSLFVTHYHSFHTVNLI